MHITDDLDQYNGTRPRIDTEVDLDAPYIDFDYVENSEELDPPANGIWDTLFYLDKKLLYVNQIVEVEIRLYTSQTPNEAYRVGQRHIKGKVRTITKVDNYSETDGFILSFDASTQYNGKIKTVCIDKEYVEITKTRCISIVYFDEEGEETEEVIIPIDVWFTPKVYINSALIVDERDAYPFEIGNLVDVEFYVRKSTDPNKITYTIEKRSITGRIVKLEEMQRNYTEKDENGIDRQRIKYYYRVVFDISELYDFNQFSIASTVITKMTIREVYDPYH